ncbi:MAG TPA: NAD-dependent epimerase/dehydratase family protein [Bacteroidales bacterium]|mgnify:FL=1|jgi:UDP-glucose 4-epimerase|nr:NAD-dependent epimerase/dehydratase family protein [Bacteroidales bacterium]HNZ43318.1 NAD-dependent epimerase/dehydratase family protein [Bacteroidales bacterium]HPB25311.1 NAD-dependent epimerase/dehydratase family protein [Bacteroidales bacterium]HPI29232.1 NAD-dependent epimerase/dehydratase family protein [Bacteroidales bacterium]HQN15147.1 NAD-dependent epimerase/dehydratase family protein [Bacteroidales bacterium]
MRTILITGGAGFIGSCLAEKMISDPENFVVIVDDLTTGDVSKLPSAQHKNWRFIKCNVNDYRDISAVMLSFPFDYVFHYAAVVGVQRTQLFPVKVLNDIKGISNILNLSKNSHVKRVYFSSSSEVYGEPVELPQNELTTPLNSRVPYAVVKNIGEAYLKSYHKEYGLDYTIFRFFNTYGPKQSRDFVMSRFMALALKNQNITIYGDGSQSRTFCYINDNVDACYASFVNSAVKNVTVNDIINIGNDNEISILDLANKIISLTNSQSKIVYKPPLEEGDMHRRLPDTTKMRKLLGRPMLSIDEGIKKLIENPLFLK